MPTCTRQARATTVWVTTHTSDVLVPASTASRFQSMVFFSTDPVSQHRRAGNGTVSSYPRRGTFEFHCDYLPQGLVGVPLGRRIPGCGVHTYVHFVEYALERERSDGCSREKSTEEHFAGNDLSDGVIGICFLHRPRDRANDLEGRKERTDDFCLRDTKTWMSMYHTAFFFFFI